jgi:hypothetical protein
MIVTMNELQKLFLLLLLLLCVVFMIVKECEIWNMEGQYDSD